MYGPVYLRFTRDTVPMIYMMKMKSLPLGKQRKLRMVRILRLLPMVIPYYLALEATKELEKEGISVKVLDMHTIKPLDREAVVECLTIWQNHYG